jgi:TolB-like protein
LQLFKELQRRNVFRVAIGYIISSWLLAQVADLVLENIGAPDWVMQTIMLVLALGFPVVLFFSWAYEVTSEGIKRESEINRTQSITHVTGRKLDRAIVAVLVIALAYFAYDKFVLSAAREAALIDAATQAVTERAPVEPEIEANTEKSIAVLPFVNMSDDKDYFADGLSEELLNLLAKIPDLKVVGRTSSFAFKGKSEDLRTIGEALSVAHVLEGSVRRSGERLRITAQLIKVDDGYHIWSETYDRQMADIFDIQDDVAQAITEALKLHLTANAERPTENTQAYALYLEALALSIAREEDDINQGLALLDRAIELDPTFAEAWGLRATFYWQAGGWVLDNSEAQRLTYEAAIKALELDPSLNEARSFASAANPDTLGWNSEIEALETWVKAEPANANAMIPLTYGLLMTGYFNEVIDLADRIIELEPLASIGYLRKGEALSAAGRREEAQAAWLKAVELGGEFAYPYLGDDELIAGNDELGADYYSAYFQLIGADPEAVRSLIQNARDPDTGKAFLDNWIVESVANASTTEETIVPYFWYLSFGYLDDYFDAVNNLRGKGAGWTNAETLEVNGMTFRRIGYTRHPAYLENAESDGLFDLWDQRGAPDHCQKVDGDWVCE